MPEKNGALNERNMCMFHFGSATYRNLVRFQLLSAWAVIVSHSAVPLATRQIMGNLAMWVQGKREFNAYDLLHKATSRVNGAIIRLFV